jgi:hypothetical protein
VQEVFKKLKAKQQMATMKQAAQKKEKNKPSAESAAPAPPAAPEQKANKSEAATVQPVKPRSAATPPDRDMIRLRRCVQALEVAVTEGKENRCKRCVADLECEDPAKLATVLDKGIRQRLLWIAGTEVGNVDTLRYLSKLFGVQWEAEVFEARGKGMKTLLGGALERKQFKVADAVLGGLKATSMGTETLKKAALDSLKVETAPLTTAIHRGAPMGLVSLILDGYSKLMRTCNERSPSDLTPLGASLQQSDTKVCPPPHSVLTAAPYCVVHQSAATRPDFMELTAPCVLLPLVRQWLELLVGKTDILMKFSAPEFSSVSPLYYAVFVRSLRKVSILLDAAAGVGLSSEEMTNFLEGKIQLNTPLFLAVKEQYNEIALKLMQAGASFMGTGSSGMTVLHLAVTESKNDSPSDILKVRIPALLTVFASYGSVTSYEFHLVLKLFSLVLPGNDPASPTRFQARHLEQHSRHRRQHCSALLCGVALPPSITLPHGARRQHSNCQPLAAVTLNACAGGWAPPPHMHTRLLPLRLPFLFLRCPYLRSLAHCFTSPPYHRSKLKATRRWIASWIKFQRNGIAGCCRACL